VYGKCSQDIAAFDRDIVSGRVVQGIDSISNKEIGISYLHNRGPAKQKLASIRSSNKTREAACLESLPEVDSLHTNRAVP
jgi:hypothetical protein